MQPAPNSVGMGGSLERSMVETSCQATTTWPCGEPSHSCEAGRHMSNTRCKHSGCIFFLADDFLGFVLKICWSWRIHNCHCFPFGATYYLDCIYFPVLQPPWACTVAVGGAPSDAPLGVLDTMPPAQLLTLQKRLERTTQH